MLTERTNAIYEIIWLNTENYNLFSSQKELPEDIK